MSVITGDRGVELLRQAAEPGAHDRQIVNARLGRHQQWMGLDEAVSIVEHANGVYLRDDARNFQLMVEASGDDPNREIYQFDVDVSTVPT